MEWKRIGKIFNPEEHTLANNCFLYAQSPQTIIFDNYIRIYFSTREKDEHGKYLSHIAFVDFDKKFKTLINISKKTVIPLGELGCFDEHGIFPINLLKEEDRILAYTTGWNRKVSVSADASIGLAISHDNGNSFEKIGFGPIVTSSLNEPFIVADAFVNKYEGLYHMWYIYGSKWITTITETEPQRVYKIVHAISSDGINWIKEGKHIISDRINENECQALPTVVYFNSKYHMFFCYRHAIGFRNQKEKGYKIGYAYSTDLKNWIRDDEMGGLNNLGVQWDSEMMCYPHIFLFDDNVYLLYNGNEFGKYGFGLAKLKK